MKLNSHPFTYENEIDNIVTYCIIKVKALFHILI